MTKKSAAAADPANEITPPDTAAREPDDTPAEADMHVGKGGMYVIVDGQRQLVERTETSKAAQAAESK